MFKVLHISVSIFICFIFFWPNLRSWVFRENLELSINQLLNYQIDRAQRNIVLNLTFWSLNAESKISKTVFTIRDLLVLFIFYKEVNSVVVWKVYTLTAM